MKTLLYIVKTGLFLPLVLILALVLTSGCAIKLIADYDELIDRYATELQSSNETFLIKMERLAGTVEGSYTANTGFYDEIRGTLTTLLLRAETIDGNEIVAKQIVLLQENLENLRKLHQKQGDKGLTGELTGPVRVAFKPSLRRSSNCKAPSDAGKRLKTKLRKGR